MIKLEEKKYHMVWPTPAAAVPPPRRAGSTGSGGASKESHVLVRCVAERPAVSRVPFARSLRRGPPPKPVVREHSNILGRKEETFELFFIFFWKKPTHRRTTVVPGGAAFCSCYTMRPSPSAVRLAALPVAAAVRLRVGSVACTLAGRRK